MVQLVVTFFDNLIAVDPHIAIPGQHVHMCLRFPVCVRLASVWIAERDVYAGEFFVLQKNSNHLRQPKVCSERQLTDAVAVLIRLAIVPKFLF